LYVKIIFNHEGHKENSQRSQRKKLNENLNDS